MSDSVRRLAAILDYVAADYPAAVRDGEIQSEPEYAEQLTFLADADAIAASLPVSATDLDLPARLARLNAAAVAVAPGAEVSELARALRRDLLADYRVVVAPVAAPSFERGRALFLENCARCHGEGGAGDGPRTRETPALKVPPRSFLSAEVMNSMSPVRAFNALTDGIERAEMPKWDLLPPADRWSLAFYVMTLRHGDEDAARGGDALGDVDASALPTGLGRLSAATDDELLTAAQDAGLAEPMAAVAHLRRRAPYREAGSLARSRQLLGESLAAYDAGDTTAARSLAAAAYLEGFEPHEQALRGTDPDLADRIEREFVSLRRRIADGANSEQIGQELLRLSAALESAEEALARDRSGTGTAVIAYALTLREGLEAALLVLLLIGLVRNRRDSEEQQQRRDLRAIHIGWSAAVAVGVVAWFAADFLLDAVSGEQREWVEGIVSLLAAAVLLVVGHYVLAARDARRRIGSISARVAGLNDANRQRALASLAFVAVFREVFETVLFLHAIALDRDAFAAIAAGALLAVATLALVVVIATQLGLRLRPQRFLGALGFLVCMLAVVLAGDGVRSLQEVGAVGITPLAGPRMPELGLYPTVETLITQLAVLAVAAALALFAARAGRAPRVADAN